MAKIPEDMAKLSYATKLLETLLFEVLQVPVTDGTIDTPKRMANMLIYDLLGNMHEPISVLDQSMKVFDSEGYKGTVVVKDIPFYSMCEHHLLPFFGKVTIEYIPNEHVLGLSKLPRVVDFFSKMPQLQERLTQEIADYIMRITDAKYVKVRIHDTTHMCVTMRGIQSECSTDTEIELKKDVVVNASMIGQGTKYE